LSQRVPTQTVPNAGGGSLVASRVLSTKGCKLLSLLVYNNNAAQQFIQVHETNALPADGSIPKLPAIPVGGKSITNIDLGVNGIDLDALTVCNSSTPDTKTIGAADCAIAATILG